MIRKMASVRRIDGIEPIDGADRIEVAVIGGWRVVVRKGEFSEGDKCVYFEIDSCLPSWNAAFASFMDRSIRKWVNRDEDGSEYEFEGHVLKTVKLRGQVSQGLCMPLGAFGIDPSTDVGTDVSKMLGVVRYDPKVGGDDRGIGGYPDAYALRSDAERVQNLSDEFDELLNHEWYATVKVDGESRTYLRDAETGDNRLATRNREVRYDGTEVRWLRESGIEGLIAPGEAVQFEWCGPGHQGNRLGLPGERGFVFAYFRNRACVPRDEWPEELVEAAVPVLEISFPTSVGEAVSQADGLRGNVTAGRLDEGIVWHTSGGEPLDCLGGRDCFKAINNSYLLKDRG